MDFQMNKLENIQHFSNSYFVFEGTLDAITFIDLLYITQRFDYNLKIKNEILNSSFLSNPFSCSRNTCINTWKFWHCTFMAPRNNTNLFWYFTRQIIRNNQSTTTVTLARCNLKTNEIKFPLISFELTILSTFIVVASANHSRCYFT